MDKENKALVATGGGAMMVANLEEQIGTIQLAMKNLMKDKVHYGTIPGCGDKPALLKPGAEKLIFMFRLAPKFEVETIHMDNGHREVVVTTLIYDNQGNFLGQGIGSCSTMESKYRWRNAGKPCPECGFIGSIFRGKAEFGGGYYCNANKGGCGKSFKGAKGNQAASAGCKAIDAMKTGKVENPDLADQYNTVLKMSKKRSLVDATLTVTAASDVFEQDLDEFSEAELDEIRAKRNEAKGKPVTEPPKTKKKDPPPKKTAEKKKDPPPAADQDQTGGSETGSSDPTFSFDEYKSMAAENKDDLRSWWNGICNQAMTDLGLKKYDLLEKYMAGALGLKMDD